MGDKKIEDRHPEDRETSKASSSRTRDCGRP